MNKDSFKLIITIVERGKGKNVLAMYSGHRVQAHLQCAGRGTASSELMDTFGFGTAERDVLISLAPSPDADRLLQRLEDATHAALRAKGIAFSMSLNAMNNLLAAALLNSAAAEEGEEPLMEKKGRAMSLILAAVDQGSTDDVMNTAREAGARGGTVLRARWAGGKAIEQFYGIMIQEEKEIIAIVASAERRNAILEAINKNHGLRSDAHGMICSVPLDKVARIG